MSWFGIGIDGDINLLQIIACERMKIIFKNITIIQHQPLCIHKFLIKSEINNVYNPNFDNKIHKKNNDY